MVVLISVLSVAPHHPCERDEVAVEGSCRVGTEKTQNNKGVESK